MKQSHLFSKTTKTLSADIKAISHQLLLRGGFVFPIASGIYALSPLGFKVAENIKNVIREDFDTMEVQEIAMPIVHPAKIWKQTGRFDEIGDELWRIKNRENEDFVLSMTHEETAGYISRTVIQTYKDLPIKINQFQTKVRDELRPKGGMLRLKEFVMQDAYSFDTDEKNLDESYQKFYDSYHRIFKSLDMDVVAVEASSGVMSKDSSHEFMVPSENGEDEIMICSKCDYRANTEIVDDSKKCPKCSESLEPTKAIELGHTFKLGLKYSEPFDVKFKDSEGKENLVYMGSYGIGIERAMTAIVETHNDKKGIVWPENVAPFKAHLISLNKNEEADKIYKELRGSGVEVLYDDRDNKAPGEKFADADLIGIPFRLVVSEKTLKEEGAEIKKRDEDKAKIVPLRKIIQTLKPEMKVTDFTK